MRSLDPIAIDALLPQTQCTQCGYSGCLPYAEAIAKGAAGINQCPPGGDEGIHALSMLTELPYAPLNPVHGEHQPRVLAVIDEAACIGCTICIQKCPVDAIAGAAKLMHTVIASECTGCELCVAPCPVDCIALVPAPASHPALAAPQAAADTARQRHRARLARLQRLARRRTEGRAASDIPAEAGIHGPMGPGVRRDDIRSADPPPGSPEHKKRAIAAAQARARARRDASRTP